ncbi:DUF2255 family protein [Aeromicrobium sp. zg-629]|nr:DUF2255 family protein [Aeromicrobium senzhongii]
MGESVAEATGVVMSSENTTLVDEAGRSDEVTISGVGQPPDQVPIWIVKSGKDLYVRSYRGPTGRWYRRVREAGQAVLGIGGKQLEVRVEPVGDHDQAAINAAYVHKYGHYGPAYIGPMTSEDVVSTTLRLVPQ